MLVTRKLRVITGIGFKTNVKKKSFSFSLNRNFRRSTLAALAFCKNFANKMAKLLRLGIKNKRIYFVLLSTFRNFAA